MIVMLIVGFCAGVVLTLLIVGLCARDPEPPPEGAPVDVRALRHHLECAERYLATDWPVDAVCEVRAARRALTGGVR